MVLVPAGGFWVVNGQLIVVMMIASATATKMIAKNTDNSKDKNSHDIEWYTKKIATG